VYGEDGSVSAIYKQVGSNPNNVYLSEVPLYGTSRLGMMTFEPSPETRHCSNCTAANNFATGVLATRRVGAKLYELTDHLGNVRAVIGDVKLADGTSFKVDLKSYTNYYPYGMAQPGRETGDYRYGYNGMEEEDNQKGEGNALNTYYRLYDPRLGLWLGIDPVVNASESPYVSMGGNPVLMSDPDGDTPGTTPIQDTPQFVDQDGNPLQRTPTTGNTPTPTRTGSGGSGSGGTKKTKGGNTGTTGTGGNTGTTKTGGNTGTTKTGGNTGTTNTAGSGSNNNTGTQATGGGSNNSGNVNATNAPPPATIAVSRLQPNTPTDATGRGSGPHQTVSDRIVEWWNTPTLRPRSIIGKTGEIIPERMESPKQAFTTIGTVIGTGLTLGAAWEVAAGRAILGATATVEAENLATNPTHRQQLSALIEKNANNVIQTLESTTPRAHYLARHGPQVTFDQLFTRATTGITPEGLQGPIVNSSAFFNNQIMLNAIQRAQTIYSNTGVSNFQFNLGVPVGYGILRGGTGLVSTTNVQAIFNRSGQLITLFPYLNPVGL
jgi:RHS repeat-associated protein